jgi:uncharacterized protein
VAEEVIHRPFLWEPRRGDLLRGEVRIPEGPIPRSAVVLVHGFTSFRGWGFFPWLAGRLVAAGHAVVSFDFSRNGVGSDPESFTELDRFGANTLSIELHELRALIAELLDGDLLPRRPRRLGLLGHGRGGAYVVLAAAAEPRVSAISTWGAPSYFDRWTAETKARWRDEGRIWILDRRTGQHMPLDVTLLDDFEANRTELDIIAAAGRVRAPWLIVHGREDLSVWPGEAEMLARANALARLHLAAGADHNFQATHPFGEPSPQLTSAATRTVEHFAAHLGDDSPPAAG